MIKVNNCIIDQNHFPAGELFIKLPEIKDKDEIIYIDWHYENDAELFTLICIKRHYQYNNCILTLPYIGHARMDRVKNENDVFTLKYFCEVINSLNFMLVRVLDPHSNVSTALLDRVKVMNVDMHVYQAATFFQNIHPYQEQVLFFPDEGAMKRYSEFTTSPYTFGVKKRRWEDGQILGLQIMNPEIVKDKHVLIVDDICSRGGTFYHSAKALKDAGAADIGLYITHCENTILQGEVFTSGLFKRVYTTDSLVHCDELKEKLIYV